MENFKDRLNEALQIRQMSAAELSRLSGVNEGAISQYKKGMYKASQRNLDRIAQALNVPIPWLMGLVDESPFKLEITEKEKQLLVKIRQLDDTTALESYLEFLLEQQNRR